MTTAGQAPAAAPVLDEAPEVHVAPGPPAPASPTPAAPAAPSVAGPVAGLVVIALAGAVVGLATASGVVGAIAFVAAALALGSALVVTVAARALRPVPPPASVLRGAPATALAAMAGPGLVAYEAEVRGVQAELEARARRAGAHANALTGAGLAALLVALPAFLPGGDPPGGRAALVALLLVALAPVGTMALLRAVLLGEWSPPLVPPPPATATADEMLRTQTARRLLACAVAEVVAARRARLVHVMTWLLAVEAGWLVLVALLRIAAS